MPGQARCESWQALVRGEDDCTPFSLPSTLDRKLDCNFEREKYLNTLQYVSICLSGSAEDVVTLICLAYGGTSSPIKGEEKDESDRLLSPTSSAVLEK